MNTKTPPELVAEMALIDSLLFDPANPNKETKEEEEALCRSIQEFGFVSPVLVRRADRVIIGGHHRVTAARKLGYKVVPVTWFEGSQEKARLLGIALNK